MFSPLFSTLPQSFVCLVPHANPSRANRPGTVKDNSTDEKTSLVKPMRWTMNVTLPPLRVLYYYWNEEDTVLCDIMYCHICSIGNFFRKNSFKLAYVFSLIKVKKATLSQFVLNISLHTKNFLFSFFPHLKAQASHYIVNISRQMVT